MGLLTGLGVIVTLCGGLVWLSRGIRHDPTQSRPQGHPYEEGNGHDPGRH